MNDFINNGDLITNGGIRITLKAHAICGHCVDYEDYQTENVNQADMFYLEAEKHFKKLGWSFSGKKVRCPGCVNTKKVTK